ncbi:MULTISPECIES: asparagine synthase (glutamine-hydrolyzing) [Streptomyces]|uniref:asparagine synthase (glutamine-hydrolyzing) n=1 Tax=Streptomyces TaxID=1883 RepID=UPI00167D27FC|nr:asparagine synthase (glutamine-hydrolyzing) [Streptomyces umbrinus]MCR3724465.1 asparagine synthase (glutamine-hydrolyzing) [Streptomyces umbrinus]GHH51396.1 asparagine synthetase B [Streptomyces umbrinus]
MCGFVGFSDISGGQEAARATAERMLAAVAHRGPDGSNWCHHRGMTFAHCALTFVDPDRGRQPFVSASGATALVLNGEIYNHEELRRELRAAGVRLRTAGDTEVLVELYELHGMKVLERVRGMYAFVLHDARTATTVLARDPMGKKPLYYTRVPGGIAFASELTALLRHPDAPRTPDVRALAGYLTLQAFCAPGSAVTDVHKVRPGSYLEHSGGRLREVEFWRPRLATDTRTPGVREAAARFEELFRAAVARRVTSTDRRLGVLLSGGLDSSAVAAVAQQLSPQRPVLTFSAGFEQHDFDESAHARSVARHLGTEHHVVRIGGRQLADVVESEYARADEPLADPSLLPTRIVCRTARQHVRGVLTGDGADELLLGYRYFQAERAIEMLLRLMPAPRLEALVRTLVRRLPARSGNLPVAAALGLLARGLRAAPEHRFYLSTAPFGPAELPGLLRPDAHAALAGHDPFAEVSRLLDGQPGLTGVQRSQLAVVAHFLRDVILTKTDRGGMRSALELRSPFLDLDLVEYGNALPTSLKLRRFTGKYLLRRVAADWLPTDIVRRTKLGFRAPLAALLRHELRPLLLDTLSSSALDRGGLFDARAVRLLTDDHLSGRRDTSRKLWALLTYQLWYQALPTHTPSPACLDLTEEPHRAP